jgi:hypothetical protein
MNQKEQLEQELASYAERQYQQQKELAERLLTNLCELQNSSEIVEKLTEVVNSFTDQQMASIDPNYAGRKIDFDYLPAITDEAAEKNERIFDHQLRSEINKFRLLVTSLSTLSLKRSILEWGREEARPHFRTLDEYKRKKSELEPKIHRARGLVTNPTKNKEQTDTLALLENELARLIRTKETANIALANIATNMRNRFDIDDQNPRKPSFNEILPNSNTVIKKLSSPEVSQNQIKSQLLRTGPTIQSSKNTKNKMETSRLISTNKGSSSTRNFRDDLKTSVASLAEAVLEVLSDGKKRNLSDIANAIWDTPEQEPSRDYQKTLRSLTTTVAREVQRGNIFRNRRGVFSTCMFDKTSELIRLAFDQNCIELRQSELEPNDIAIFRDELFNRITDEKNHSTQNHIFQAAPVRRDIVQLLDRVSTVDDLAIPRLGIEFKIIKKKGNLFIFSDDQIGVLDRTRIEVSSEGLEVDPEQLISENLRFTPDSPIIAFLDEHTAIRSEISALIRLNVVCFRTNPNI